MMMDRAEKRRLERSVDKNEKWFTSLPLDKKIFVGNLIEQQTSENDALIAKILDTCVMSAIDDNIDINIDILKKIIKEHNDYMLEYKLYLDKMGYEGGFDMIENVERREKAKQKIKEYIKGKMQKTRAIKLLKSEFNLPDAELSNMWIQCRAEGTRDEKNIQVALDYEAKKVGVVEVKKADLDTSNGKKDVVTEVVIDKDGITITDDEHVLKVPATTSKLRVVNVIHDIQGEYGLYTVSKNGVYINGKNYKDIAEMEDERNKFNTEYANRTKDLLKQIEELNMELKMTNEIHDNEMKKYDEIKEVFSY
jgi:hypothetical protein